MDNNLVGWYRTMQLGHFSEHGVKTEGGPGGLRSQKTLFDCPPALAVRFFFLCVGWGMWWCPWGGLGTGEMEGWMVDPPFA